MGIFLVWHHKLLCMHVYKDFKPFTQEEHTSSVPGILQPLPGCWFLCKAWPWWRCLQWLWHAALVHFWPLRWHHQGQKGDCCSALLQPFWLKQITLVLEENLDAAKSLAVIWNCVRVSSLHPCIQSREESLTSLLYSVKRFYFQVSANHCLSFLSQEGV